MTVNKVLGKVVNFLPMTEGAAGGFRLNKKLLEMAAENVGDKEVSKAIRQVVREYTNPQLEVAYKAKSNYAIAGLRLKDGDKVVGQAALSVSNPATSKGVVKYHVSSGSSRANGFVDAGKTPDIHDVSSSVSRRNGQVKVDARVGDATAHHVEINEAEMMDAAKKLNIPGAVEKFTKKQMEAQQQLDAAMAKAREILSGDAASGTSTASKVTGKVSHSYPSEHFTKIAGENPHINKKVWAKMKEILPPEKLDELSKYFNDFPI